MKTIEDIEKEFNEHECRIVTIDCLKELKGWIEVAYADIDENNRLLDVDYKYNRNSKILGYLTNLLPFLFEHEDLSFYDKDNEYIEDSRTINNLYKDYFKKIDGYCTEENYAFLAKFADFVMLYYDNDTNYIYDERVGLEYRRKGYGYISNCGEDNSLVVHEFITIMLNQLSETKGIEKVIKM